MYFFGVDYILCEYTVWRGGLDHNNLVSPEGGQTLSPGLPHHSYFLLPISSVSLTTSWDHTRLILDNPRGTRENVRKLCRN